MQEIICPHCGHKHTDPEFFEGITTYHGEDGPKDVVCWLCDQDFAVIEVVTRHWKVGKTIDAAEAA